MKKPIGISRNWTRCTLYRKLFSTNWNWNINAILFAGVCRKFIYRTIRSGARAREYEDALLWLEEAGLIYRIFNISKPGLPLSAYRDVSAFKVYACDCGLLRRLARLSPEIILSGSSGYTEFKGALTENAVG